MSTHVSRHRHGWTLVEVSIYIVITVVLAGWGLQRYMALRDRAASVMLDEATKALNHATIQYVTTGGPVSNPPDPADLFTRLQTPVDAKSRAAGFGLFDAIDPTWTLQGVPAGYTGDRIALGTDANGTPQWTLVGSGDGFLVIQDRSRKAPAEADWTAIVDAKAAVSQVGARKSQWLWEYADKPNASRGSGGGGGRPKPDYSTNDAVLSITGPTTISTAGTAYCWTGVSSIPGDLTITVQGTPTSAAGATSVVSPKMSFSEGTHLEFDVTIARAQGGSGPRKHVVVDIASRPAVEIAGPERVTTSAPVTWTAQSSVTASPIAIRVPGLAEQSQWDTRTVSATHAAWPAGTKITDFKVVASALNASGLGLATKIVQIDIPEDPNLVWALDPAATGGTVTTRGAFAFTAVGSNVDASSARIVADLIPSGLAPYITPMSDSANGLSLRFAVDTSSLPETSSLTGEFSLSGTLTAGSTTKSADQKIIVEIPRTKVLASWTVAVTGDGVVSSLQLNIAPLNGGDAVSPRPENSGARSHTWTVPLGPGTYHVWGQAIVGGDLVIPEGVGSESAPLSFTVTP